MVPFPRFVCQGASIFVVYDYTIQCVAVCVANPIKSSQKTNLTPARQPFVKIAFAAISVREFHIWNAAGRNSRVDFDISMMAPMFYCFLKQ